MCISAPNRSPRRAAALILIAGLSGCAVGPDFVRPDGPAVARYAGDADPVTTIDADGVAQHFTPEARLPADWWRLFDCPALDDAVRQGLTASPTIAAAEANLRAARHDLAAGQGIFFPQLDAGASAARGRPSALATPGVTPEGVFNLFTLSASVDYALDIFGGERRAVEALAASADYQKNVARAASLALASNIANILIAATAYDAEIAATREIIDLERDQVRLATVQAKSGTLSYAGVLIIQTQLETSEATLPPLLQKRAQSEHLLAVLAGRLPAEGQTPHLSFADLSLPRDLPLSLPAELVRQRPDILQAEAALHIASAGIGVATAALLPSLTLDGTIGFSDTKASGLIGPQSRFWSFGAGLTTPIFHGGTLWYQRQAAIDAYDAATANYRQTVLTAFQQVADTLRALEHDAEALATQDRASHTALRALQLVLANERAGIATYTDLLIANAQYHQALIADIGVKAARYQDTVALFAALGGGWWNEPSAPE